MNIFVDRKEAAAEVRTQEAVAEQRRERDWKRTEEMQHNARGYDVKLSGS